MIHQLTTRTWKLVAEAFHIARDHLRVLARYWLIGVVATFYVAIFWRDPFSNLPFLATTVFSTVTLVFAYFAYQFSKEKFRLDLFDKRFAVYEATLEFCSRVVSHGSLQAANNEQREAVTNAIKAAEASFRGIGYHKARALFGDDIRELFSRLNKSYAWLATFGNGPGNSMTHEQWVQRDCEHITFIWDTASSLPELFRAYVYFGDYKRP